MKREFDFSEEFGKINERLVEEAGREWKGGRGQALRLYSRKMAGVAAVVLLCICAANSSRVQASVREIVTRIAQIWQVQEDLSPYTEVINKAQEKEGFRVALNEVIVSQKKIYASVTVNSNYPDGFFDCGESVTINGKELKLASVSDETPAFDGEMEDFEQSPSHLFTMELRDIPEKISDIRLHFLAYKNSENSLNGENAIPFEFGFTVTKEELEQNKVEVDFSKKIPLGNGMEMKVLKVVITAVDSRIEAKISGVNVEEGFVGYYLEGVDSLGNQVSYFMDSVDNQNRFTFTSELREGGLPSVESEWMELRLYTYQNMPEEEQQAVDGEEIMVEDEDGAMNQVYLGEKFKLDYYNGDLEEDYGFEPLELDEEDIVDKEEFTIDDIKELARKGEGISVWDIAGYSYYDRWPEEGEAGKEGIYIYEYAVEGGLSLWVRSGFDMETMDYIHLKKAGTEEFLDLRHTTAEEIEAFVKE